VITVCVKFASTTPNMCTNMPNTLRQYKARSSLPKSLYNYDTQWWYALLSSLPQSHSLGAPVYNSGDTGTLKD